MSDKRLAAAIENLYEAFQPYTSWSHEPGCPCCTDPALAEPMLKKKLRDLTHKDLLGYIGSAMTTWGDLDDYKHFLPRIIELCTMKPPEEALGWDTYTTCQNLANAAFGTWPTSEKKAVRDLVSLWWKHILCDSPSQVPVSGGEKPRFYGGEARC